MTGDKPVILYFYYKRSSFVVRDIQSLSTQYHLIEFAFRLKKHFLFSDVFRQLIFICRHWNKAGIYVCFFAGYHSFLPALLSKLTSKKCLIIAGGTDCVSFPAINYGNFLKQPLRFFTCASFRMTSCIAPVHDKLSFYQYTYDDTMPKTQGILAHCPRVKSKINPVYNGYDASHFKPANAKIKRSFLTVTYGIGTPVINRLKGIDLILLVASDFPECTFNLVGQLSDDFPSPVPGNVHLFPQSNQDQLLRHYQENEYYLQLSLSEGFPNSLCEAMLCGCVPIGSDVGGITDIIGDTGFILYRKDKEKLKELIGKALDADIQALAVKARERIFTNFQEEKRTSALLKLIAEM